jgi:hypothetical protein
MKAFEAIKNLFPLSKAFQLFTDNNKRKLIKGLSRFPENVRHELELVYDDLFPYSTRFPEKWENVFGIFFTESELSKRRDILDSLWKINNGGQGWEYLQDILSKIDPNIHVVENIPLHNPKGKNLMYMAVCDNMNMICDGRYAICDYREGDELYKTMATVIMNDISEVYTIPDDPAFWETCFFICKSVTRNANRRIMFIERLQISAVWKNYIEYLVLKIKPVHTTAILFVEWL